MAVTLLMKNYIRSNSSPVSHSTRVATMTKQSNQQVVKRNRVQLFVLVRILFQYLEKVDPSTLLLQVAKEILVDCERKHGTEKCEYSSLAHAIEERLREAVGEAHWNQARKIQKQLMLVHHQRKTKAIMKEKMFITRAVSP